MDSEKKNSDNCSFHEAMADVKPLRVKERIEPVPKMTPARALQKEHDDRAVLQELLDPDHDLAELETGEELLFLRPGHQKRLLSRLRQGHFSAVDSIDLHHMNVETAGKVLLDFLEHALKQNYGCIRVVHGKGLRSKGLPLLKNMTNRMLRKHPRVVAFASCRPVDGGTGATNVLLTSRKGKNQ